jgi:FkbM family methyltransferase
MGGLTATRQLRIAQLALGYVPAGSGVYRLTWRVLKHTGLPPVTTRQRLKSGAMLDLHLDDGTECRAFLVREYEPALIAFIAKRLTANSVFVDVGAHIGLVALQVASRVPGVRVHAFEPDPATRERLENNVSINQASIEVRPEALADSVGTMSFSTVGDAVAHHLTSDQTGGLTVDVVTLDTYMEAADLPRIDVLKVDAEGYDLQVLNGASQHLGDGSIGTVIFEIHPELIRHNGGKIDRLLTGFGYRPVVIPRIGFSRLRRTTRQLDVAYEIPR